MSQSPTELEKYQASFILCGSGDAFGYHLGRWEFAEREYIEAELELLGGIDKIELAGEMYIVSDDTVMNIASADGMLMPAKTADEMLTNIYTAYRNCMADMRYRAPGIQCMKALLTQDPQPWNALPFSKKAGGCGASMRAMAFGLRFPRPDQLNSLVVISLEAGRITHHHPTGYLGGVAAAVLTSYALQGVPIASWGAKFYEEVLPLCRKYVTETKDRNPEENIAAFDYFENHWTKYLDERGIRKPTAETKAKFPEKYGPNERDEFYRSFSYSGNGGSSGDDSVIIAYDALLFCEALPEEQRWHTLIDHGALHSGDSDSTGAIACSIYGALHGFAGVNPLHYQKIEYHDRMMDLGKRMLEASQTASPLDTIPLGPVKHQQ